MGDIVMESKRQKLKEKKHPKHSKKQKSKYLLHRRQPEFDRQQKHRLS